MKKTVEKTLEELIESFKKLDTFTVEKKEDIGPTSNRKISDFSSANLTNLEERLEDMEDSLDFLEEKKILIEEIIKTLESNDESLDIEKKSLILGYIKSSHTGEIDPDLRHLASEISDDDLLSLCREALSGLQSFLSHNENEIRKIKQSLLREQEKEDEIKKEIFVSGKKQDFEQDLETETGNGEFDLLVEKIDILLKELELLMREEQDQEMLEQLRREINF